MCGYSINHDYIEEQKKELRTEMGVPVYIYMTSSSLFGRSFS